MKLFMHVEMKLAVIFTLFIVCSSATASVIHDENLDGDLDNTQTLNLGLGANVIIGSTAAGENNADGSTFGDSDFFTFLMPANSKLTSITYSFSNVGQAGFIYDLTYRLGITLLQTPWWHMSNDPFHILTGTYVYDQNTQSGEFLVGTSPAVWNNFPHDIVDGGTYRWQSGYASYSGTVGQIDQATWDYSVTFQVASLSQIPVPAPLALIGLGLVAVGLNRRKIV